MDRGNELPPIPEKRYFTIGEVSELCLVKPYVLRYWEQEFVQLRPMKRRGNRRYYQPHEVQLVRRIRELLYDQGFTIVGARNRLAEMGHTHRVEEDDDAELASSPSVGWMAAPARTGVASSTGALGSRALQASQAMVSEALPRQPDMDALSLRALSQLSPQATEALRASLLSIRDLLL
jgi:DNA-binding transcriptional MerR regulator